MFNAKNRHRRGAIMHIVAGALGLGLIAATFIAAIPHRGAPARPSIDPPQAVPGWRASGLLARLALGPKQLAAAGVTANQTTALIGRARGHMADHLAEIVTSDDGWYTANHGCEVLIQRVQSGLASEQEVSDLGAARSALAAATSGRQTLLDALLAASIGTGESALEVQQAGLLSIIRDNGAWNDLPVQYLCVNRSEADWVRLRNSLADIRLAGIRGEEPNPVSVLFVAECDTDGTVSTAASNLGSLGPGVLAAWNEAIDGH